MSANHYCIASLSQERSGGDWAPRLLFWNRHQDSNSALFRHNGKAWDPSCMSLFSSEEGAAAEIEGEKLSHGVALKLDGIAMEHVIKRTDTGEYLQVQATANNLPPAYSWGKTPSRLREMSAEVGLMSCGVARGFLERQIRVSQPWLEKNGPAIQARMLGVPALEPEAWTADASRARDSLAQIDQMEMRLI